MSKIKELKDKLNRLRQMIAKSCQNMSRYLSIMKCGIIGAALAAVVTAKRP